MLINVIRPVPQAAVDFVKRQEACRLTAYLDPKGVPTIGWGHTGPEVHLGLVWDQATADVHLESDLHAAAAALERKVGDACISELTDNQYSALISFVYNLGTGDPNKPEWRIWGLLRAQQFDQVPPEFARFVYCGGHKLSDLVERRAEEQKLWADGEPGTQPGGYSSGTTRTVDTPPADNPVKPLSRSKSWWAGIATGGLALGNTAVGQIQSGAKAVNDAITPYAGQSVVLQHLQGSLTIALAASAVLMVALLWLKNREAKAQ